LTSIPALWDLAKRMLERLRETVDSSALARRRSFGRSERREVLCWLEPVERLVRNLLFTQALTHLLMTPEGQKLLRETPKQQSQEPPEQEPPATKTTRIPHPGWRTIAQHWQRPAPEPPKPEPPPKPERLRDLTDPSSWSCQFPLKLWTPSFSNDGGSLKKKLQPAQLLAARNERHILRGPQLDAEAAPDRRAYLMARRIEAVARVIARPRPAMLRMARLLASFPAETIWLRPRGAQLRNHWRHGNDSWEQSRDHCVLALRAYHRTLEAG
jgi:hypothetical protein